MFRTARRSIALFAAIAMALLATASPGALAQSFPAAAGDDVAPSMGKFAIWIDPSYRPLVNTSPCYVPATREFVSPLMFDSSTIIGHSAAYTDGSATDVAGPPVGSDLVPIARSVFFTPPYLMPSLNFTDGPAGTREVRTRIKSLNMVSLAPNAGTFRVRAGNLASPAVAALSPGQVEDTNPGAPDFPAESFFDIFAEIDINLPGLGTLETSDPLVITNSAVNGPLPPDVVYIHGETPAVPVRFKAGQGANSGKLFGYLRLAGHGINFGCDPNSQFACADVVPPGQQDCPDAERLLQALADAPPMPCAQCVEGYVPTLGTTGYVILLILLLGAGTVFILRRQSARVS